MTQSNGNFRPVNKTTSFSLKIRLKRIWTSGSGHLIFFTTLPILTSSQGHFRCLRQYATF